MLKKVSWKNAPKYFKILSLIWHNNCLCLRMELVMPKTNLHEELIKLKRKTNLKINLDFDPSKIDSDRLFHIGNIKKTCIDYRLRFLGFDYFKGKVPNEAYDRLKEFKHNHPDLDFKIMMMAPSKLFELENYDDPLMFVSLGNDYYYLIHKWGNDMSYFRKILMWPFKNFYNILVFICLLSFFLTAIIPDGLFYYKNNPAVEFFITFLFVLKSVIAIFIYYGFALGKNFNENIWNRKFYN